MSYTVPDNVFVYESGPSYVWNATNRIAEILRAAVQDHDMATLALSGGSTPQAIYQLLSTDCKDVIDWDHTTVLLGDERFVPYEDPQSNFGMIQKCLLSGVKPAQVLPIPTNLASAQACAEAYEQTLRQTLDKDGRIDLVLLGLGEDGHTASLFPGAPSLDDYIRWVTWSHPGTLPPPVDRITLTYEILNNARNVAFLVTGAKKTATLQKILSGEADKKQMPAAGIHLYDGCVYWLVDKDAVGH